MDEDVIELLPPEGEADDDAEDYDELAELLADIIGRLIHTDISQIPQI